MSNKLEEANGCAKAGMDRIVRDLSLHPIDTVKYYRHVSDYATRQADEQQTKNDDYGVPEREQDQ